MRRISAVLPDEQASTTTNRDQNSLRIMSSSDVCLRDLAREAGAEVPALNTAFPITLLGRADE
jgi:hypothetical protein